MGWSSASKFANMPARDANASRRGPSVTHALTNAMRRMAKRRMTTQRVYK